MAPVCNAGVAEGCIAVGENRSRAPSAIRIDRSTMEENLLDDDRCENRGGGDRCLLRMEIRERHDRSAAMDLETRPVALDIVDRICCGCGAPCGGTTALSVGGSVAPNNKEPLGAPRGHRTTDAKIVKHRHVVYSQSKCFSAHLFPQSSEHTLVTPWHLEQYTVNSPTPPPASHFRHLKGRSEASRCCALVITLCLGGRF